MMESKNFGKETFPFAWFEENQKEKN